MELRLKQWLHSDSGRHCTAYPPRENESDARDGRENGCYAVQDKQMLDALGFVMEKRTLVIYGFTLFHVFSELFKECQQVR